MIRDPISSIATAALNDITGESFPDLPSMAITGLLDDFQYAWLERLSLPYDFEMLDLARTICSGDDRIVFKMTGCASILEIREEFTQYISTHHNDDERVIIRLSFDGKKINAEWTEREDYLGAGARQDPE
jgi:hypothetical protein